MERGFLSKKGSGGGRGVKEKNKDVADKEGVVSSVTDEPVVNLTNAVKTCGGSYPPLPTQGTTPAGNTTGKSSYTNVIGESKLLAKGLRILLMASSWVSEWLTPLLLIMLGTLMVSLDWSNQCLTRLGLFFFQFSSTDGLNSMLENGPWFIRNHPLILRKWNSDVDLLKEDVGNVPVWVKLHGVPITAFSEDGLSAIATKVGTPLMLDSYTSGMCLQSWGKSSYARVMIELRADMELKDPLWWCSCCKIFGHTQEECPKNIGLGMVKNLKKPSQTSRGVLVGPKVSFKPHKEYRPVPKKQTANSSGNKKKGVVPTNEVI
ncbi:RNA-directed DNA polymerase, eukaryota, reverse transcriptase zinc-binding domain protein [Tanacetum coccineum]